ncbi:MAG: DUF5050 domain-containing protein [Ruminococcaceae bacterium]|nr:DUF5050 domain-containing protein [Oscillospiraceae bacterium]
MVNTKPGLCSEFFCSANGEVFFTNFGDREYLYKITGNGSEIVVEKPARCINYYDNKLYFLSSDNISADNIDFVGKIYCRDLESGELEMLCDEAVTSLIVSADGIYYSLPGAENGNSAVSEMRLMNFDGNSQKCFYAPEFRYVNYLIMPDGIVDLTKEENIAQPSYENIIPFSAEITNMVGACVYSEYLFYYGADKSIVLCNLCDGTTLSVPREAINELYGDQISISDYTLCGGILYLSHSSDMLTAVDLETMQITKTLIGNCGGKIVDRLYTDGIQIYALLRDARYSNPELVRLNNDNDKLSAERLG